MTAQHTKLWHLERINLLKNLSKEEMQELDRRTVMKTAAKNQFIYFPKEPSKILFFLKKGRIKIGSYSENGKEIIKTVMYPGEVFGEMGIVGEVKRKDFAVAMDNDTRLCTINTDEFKEMMKVNPNLSLELTRNIGERLRSIERKLESLVFKEARERIVDFMKEMAEKYGAEIADEIYVKHDLTHQDIASLTATSRQTVTTVLNDLKGKKLIYMERNRFLIRDMANLK